MRFNRICSPLLLFLLLCQPLSAASETGELLVVTQNLNRFYDDHDDRQKDVVYSSRKYQQRLVKLAQKIATEFNFADVIAFQEVENRAILLQLRRLLKKNYNKDYRVILEEGNDVSGIDVGFMINSKLKIESVQTLFKKNLHHKKVGKLFSRPPLLVKICPSSCITIINVHLRSMRGLNSKQRRQWVIEKRKLQAETLARWIQQFQNRKPKDYLMLLGDFNALTPSDSYVDVMGTIIGNPDQSIPQCKSADLITRDLIDLTRKVAATSRFSYRYRGRNQLLDYVLVSENLADRVNSVEFSGIDHSFSDHAALRLKIILPEHSSAQEK